jgi:hypothetical protein
MSGNRNTLGGLLGKPQLARCPKCRNVIDSTVSICRFCKAVISVEDMQAAAAQQTRIIEEKSRRNNKLATRAAIVSLIFTVIAFPLLLVARGIVIVNWGDSITRLADLPSTENEVARRITGQDSVQLGYVYNSVGVFWLDLWTWNGRYCLFKGQKFWVLKPEAVQALAHTDSGPGKPFFYTFPSGLIVLAALAAGLALWVAVGPVGRVNRDQMADPTESPTAADPKGQA